MLEQLPSLILVSSQESSACPGGACIGTGRSVGLAPLVTVLFGHLQRQIVLTEPLRIACSLTAGNTAGKISLVQITATCFGIGGFLHGTFEIVIVWTRFSR